MNEKFIYRYFLKKYSITAKKAKKSFFTAAAVKLDKTRKVLYI